MIRPSKSLTPPLPIALLVGAMLIVPAGCGEDLVAESPTGPVAQGEPVAVSGSATHFFSTAVSHSEEETAGGSIARSTDIIRLTGDLDGYVLYHPTTVVDFAAGTLVNTGSQIFSGTVVGEGPFILHDDTFRFEVQLATGETKGTAQLRRSMDAPEDGIWYECDLDIIGTGMTAEGDGLADYTGTCQRMGG